MQCRLVARQSSCTILVALNSVVPIAPKDSLDFDCVGGPLDPRRLRSRRIRAERLWQLVDCAFLNGNGRRRVRDRRRLRIDDTCSSHTPMPVSYV